MSETSAGEEKRVREIIDKLKSEGLFDQFRKECVADVDTKPAFQNLRQRVEGYVSRFLSRQVWSPTLNKNQLRDSLRRQINQSGMLAKGVERVIEQVINPKILQVIKPKIDDVICQHLNIDPKARQARLEWKKNQQKESLQTLINLSVPPPGGLQQQQQAQQANNPFGAPVPGFPPGFSGENWQSQNPQQQQSMLGNYQQGMMNYPMAMPFLPNYQYSIPPQAFPYNPWNPYMPPNFLTPPPLPGEPFPPVPTTSSSAVTTNPPVPDSPGQFGVSPKPPAVTQSPLVTQSPVLPAASGITDTPTPPKNLPPLPPIPKTPPPPGTEDEAVVIPKTPKEDTVKALFKEETKEAGAKTMPVLDDIPLPAMPPTPKKSDALKSQDFKLSEDEGSQFMATDSEDTQTTTRTGDVSEISQGADETSQEGDSKRPYKFAWDEDLEASTNMSNMSVSTVHTSDLSSFDVGSDSEMEFSDSSDDIPAPMYSPHRAGDDEDQDLTDRIEQELAMVGAITPEADDTAITAATPPPSETVTTELDSQKSDTTPTQPNPVPEVTTESPASTETTPLQSVPQVQESPKVPQVSPSKPRRLISLQYNYSDSEDEETREERKARIAKEKEERYLQRLQRRAELETRRKEREEERARQREVRKKSKEEKAKKEEITEKQDSVEDGALKSTPESPEKRKRKTKAELKEELTKQKVQEKKEALRRQRTRTRRYTSDEFTSIFTEKNQPFSSQSYSDLVVEEVAVEETIETETVETDFMVVDMNQEGIVIEQQVAVEEQQTEISVEEETVTMDTEQQQTVQEEFESPDTPTQDEKFEDSQLETSITNEESSIPIYEISVQGKLNSKVNEESKKEVAERPGSPVSDDNKEYSRGGKRKRQDSGHRSTDNEKTQRSKRYDTSDLYKPHRTFAGSRRRATSEQTNEESKSESVKDEYSESRTTKEKTTEEKPIVICLDDTSPISSRSTSRSPSPPSIRNASPISSSSASFSTRSRSRSRSRSRTKRSRSLSSSSASSVDEFGRTKKKRVARSLTPSRSRSRSRPVSVSRSRSRSHSRSRSLSKSISSGHRQRSRSSSSSGSSVDSTGHRRIRKNKKTPIGMVDFGEAARLSQRSLHNVSFGEAERRALQLKRQVFRGRGGGVAGTWQGKPTWQPYGPGPMPMEPRPFEHPGSMSPSQSPKKRFFGYGLPTERSVSPPSYQETSSPLRGGRMRPDSPPAWQDKGKGQLSDDSPPYPPTARGGVPQSPPYPPTARGGVPQSPPYPPTARGGVPQSPPYPPAARGGIPQSPPYPPTTRGGVPQSPPYPPTARGGVPQSPPYPPTARGSVSQSPPHSFSRGPVSPPYRHPSMESPTHYRSPSPPFRKQNSPLEYEGISPSPSPPPMHSVTRGQRRLSDDQQSRSPSPTFVRRQRPPSPPSRPITRAKRSPSPPAMRPVTRGQRPPSPPGRPMTRGQRHISPPIHPMTRSQRSPSPPPRGRMHLRQMSRDDTSPSPPPSPIPKRKRPTTPPLPASRPVTRGQLVTSPQFSDEMSGRELRSHKPPSPPMMSQRLRNKHNAPDRFSPPPMQSRRQRPPSPPGPPTKRGRR